MFTSSKNGGEIWSKMRSTVFPLVIIGYLLIPLASTSDVALSFTEAGGLLYLAILFFGCITLMDRTAVAGTIIVLWALLLYSLGGATGVVVTVLPTSSPFYASWTSGSIYALISVAIVLALTAATFWVASDGQVRKLWGLRRDMSPRRFNDAAVKARIEILSSQHGLTPREEDVLRFVANGRRAPEMADEMSVSQDTVRTHLKHLYSKLGVHSYAEAARAVKETEVSDSTLLKHVDSE
ncbi:response regulator transcription factor [Adlercreutzia shanghongiae]|uniref:Helix-turn-helix transcriptional regulator n=1 Tax=Adlercreutzia shanghongiae TaxID=3111773 RepID=A0ABU6J1A4_9ACTN|nr:helix-turn-helix transcriptional regulator [Adlercreutzia sp. R22]MEC4295892.1 helix-turn-helix transcriptional regulator [Adlercreutzia sp. R22]